MEFGLPWPGSEVAREAENAGISAFCTGDFVDNDAYEVLAEMVANTREARVGTSIAYAFARSPYAHASALRTLAKRAPGRLFLGLGSGAYSINRDWFGVDADKPVARLTDLAGAVRAWLHAENGKPVSYLGAFYTVDAKVQAPVMGRLDIPVLLAGFNKGMVAAAGKHADGVMGHGLFTARWWSEVVRPALGEVSSEFEEQGWLITAVDDDNPERAVLDARRMIGFYLTVKTYDPFIEHHGWVDEVERVREAFRKGDMDRLASAVTDEMVAAIAICGSAGEAELQLARRLAEGSLARDLTYLAPPSFLTSERRRAFYAMNSLGLSESVRPSVSETE